MIFKHKIIPNGARGLRKFMEIFKDNSCELTQYFMRLKKNF